MRMRVANVGLIYSKTTKLSLGALGKSTRGRVFNLAAGDVMRMQFGLMFVPYFVWGPIEALIILGLLIWEIGWAASIGWFFFILIFVPLQLFFSRWFARLQFSAAKAADHRIKLTTEVVSGAACVKSHCWEKAFVDLVDQARSKEINILTKIATLRGLNEGIFFSSTTIVGTLIFLVHTFGRGKIFFLLFYNLPELSFSCHNRNHFTYVSFNVFLFRLAHGIKFSHGCVAAVANFTTDHGQIFVHGYYGI